MPRSVPAESERVPDSLGRTTLGPAFKAHPAGSLEDRQTQTIAAMGWALGSGLAASMRGDAAVRSAKAIDHVAKGAGLGSRRFALSARGFFEVIERAIISNDHRIFS